MIRNSEFEKLEDLMIELGIATENEITLVLCINGVNLETLEDILYAKTGLRSLEQLQAEYNI